MRPIDIHSVDLFPRFFSMVSLESMLHSGCENSARLFPHDDLFIDLHKLDSKWDKAFR